MPLRHPRVPRIAKGVRLAKNAICLGVSGGFSPGSGSGGVGFLGVLEGPIVDTSEFGVWRTTWRP